MTEKHLRQTSSLLALFVGLVVPGIIHDSLGKVSTFSLKGGLQTKRTLSRTACTTPKRTNP